MKRQLYSKLLKWRRARDRKPLIVQGARQTGKTYLLCEFGNSEYEDLAYFNFEETPMLESIFAGTLSAKTLIEELSAAHGRRINPDSTLLFFNEIQACPRALTSLKYFYEQAPEYHVSAAGSLLGVSVGKSSSFPVGKVDFLTLCPMSFTEYLEAIGKTLLIERIQKNPAHKPIPEMLHHELLDALKFYLYIGGMPEVVQSYVDHMDIAEVRKLQLALLSAIENDFSKYSTPSEAMRISEIWRSIPAQLARENRKFKYSSVKRGGRASMFESAIEWLRRNGHIYLCYNIGSNRQPLSGFADRSKFKVYVFDNGLLGAMADLPSDSIVDENRIISEYSGACTENYIATELVRIGVNGLYYWASQGIAEVDFVLDFKGQLAPLEVKSGLSRRTKSLRVYADKYLPKKVYRTSPRNFTIDGDLVNIPLYAINTIQSVL